LSGFTLIIASILFHILSHAAVFVPLFLFYPI